MTEEGKKLVRAARVYDGSGSWLVLASSFASPWLLKVNAGRSTGAAVIRANRLCIKAADSGRMGVGACSCLVMFLFFSDGWVCWFVGN